MSNTGMTWDEAETGMDIPRYLALCDWWRECPPPAVQLRRLTAYVGALLGVKPADAPAIRSSTQANNTAKPPAADQGKAFAAFAHQAAQMGMPTLMQRPNDPLLDFIPAPPPTETAP